MGRAPWAIVDFADVDGPPVRRELREPREVVAAPTVAEVKPALDRAESLAATGLLVAGFVAYDAAPAFEPRFAVRGGYRGPLAWFAAFEPPDRSDPPPSGQQQVDTPSLPESPEHVTSPTGLDPLQSPVGPADHAAAVEEIIEGIRRGDYYQVNYTVPLATRVRGSVVELYERLRRSQSGRYSALIDTGESVVLSVSPELFFRRAGSLLESRPMKGTATRGRWPEEDRAASERLRSSEKERAENVMIVDLIRNDMGRISVTGSVEVPSLFDVERYPTIWQMTSHVRSQLILGTTLTDIFGALFPCGSVTGAPKIAAASAIADLELSHRGIYCGAVGVIEPGGDRATFNVAIRTLEIVGDGSATYGAGGGITADSNAAAEYRELIAKTGVLTADVDRPSLLETMLADGGVIPRLHRHLGRLAGSARYFGLPWEDSDRARIAAELTALAAAAPGRRRIRLIYGPDGRHEVAAAPLVDLPAPRRLTIAGEPVDSRHATLFHKTTDRRVYETRRSAAPEADDVILVNERGEVTETTIANLVAEIGGRRLTPALDCGLLPGVLRAELLENGEISEAVLSTDDLRRATGLWVISSLRGWVPAELLSARPS